MFDTFRLARRSRGVHQEQHILGVAGDGFDRRASVLVDQFVVVVGVTAEEVREFVAQSVDDDTRHLVVDTAKPLVCFLLVIQGIAAAVVAITGDEILAVGGVHACRECVRREASEDDAVWRADACAG